MKRIAFLAPALAALAPLAASAAHADAPAVQVAVFGIEDTRTGKARLPKKDIDNLTDFLDARLSEGTAYKAIPSARLRETMRAKKKDPALGCFETACQVDFAKEVSAQKILATKLILAGKQCVLLATLLDVADSGGQPRSIDQDSACELPALQASLKSIAAKLTEGAAKKEPDPPRARWFEAPQEQGRALDACLRWGIQCGEPAAGRWCKKLGYAGALDFEWSPVTSATVVIGESRICESSCAAITKVECADAPKLATLVRTEIAHPQVNGQRLDWCLHWGKECGRAAASAWCKKNGFERAVEWSVEIVGRQDSTYLIGDDKVCKPNCGAIRELTCEKAK